MTILDKLSDRVVHIELRENDTVARVEECCDLYFHKDLNKGEVAELIAEIQAIHDQMRTVA